LLKFEIYSSSTKSNAKFEIVQIKKSKIKMKIKKESIMGWHNRDAPTRAEAPSLLLMSER
jgi:hypothetical protein